MGCCGLDPAHPQPVFLLNPLVQAGSWCHHVIQHSLVLWQGLVRTRGEDDSHM